MTSRKRQYDENFKQNAVNYYNSSGKSLKETSKDLKIIQSSFDNCIQNAKSNDGVVKHEGSSNYSSDSEKEIARLKKHFVIKKMH